MRFGEPKLQSVKLLFYVVESQVGVGTEVGEFSIFDARIAAHEVRLGLLPTSICMSRIVEAISTMAAAA
jgi:hypothetical protein